MHDAFATIAQVKTPLQLAAFFAALLTLVAVVLLRAKKTQGLRSSQTHNVLRQILTWIGIIAVVVLVLSFVLPTPSSQNGDPSVDQSSKSYHVALTWPTSASSSPPRAAAIDEATLRNATYVLDGERITLNNGEMVFDPPEVTESVYPIQVYLTSWAFGDLTQDGRVSGVAVLQRSDGGSGIYYFLVPVTRQDSRVVSDVEGYTIGDRVQVRRLEITKGHVFVDVLMHRPDDPGGRPSLMRHLDFAYDSGRLRCDSRPCSELGDGEDQRVPSRSDAADGLNPTSTESVRHPSFDCLKATTGEEHAICDSDELARLDAQVGMRYRKLLSYNRGDAKLNLKRDQRAWIVERHQQCGAAVGCLRDYLVLRSSQLSAGE